MSKATRGGAALALHRFTAGTGPLGPLELQFSANGFTCLFGPAGAGKSLLLHAIAGLVASQGGIAFGKRPLERVPPRRRGFALLAQGGASAPIGTVAGALGFAMAARGIARRHRHAKIAALCAEFNLNPGEQPSRLDFAARLALRLAVALAGAPRVLLLDDPMQGWAEPAAAIAMLREAVYARQLSAIIATRRREEAFALADLLVLMDHGRVLQTGPLAQLYERPATLEIALHLGPANVLRGRLRSIVNDIATVQLDCGPVIEADPPHDLSASPDAACLVLLRPERVAVSTVAAAQLGMAAVAAVLREVIYMGDIIRLRLALGTDADILVARPAVLGATGLTAGRTVSVAWQSRHALTFLA